MKKIITTKVTQLRNSGAKFLSTTAKKAVTKATKNMQRHMLMKVVALQ